MTTCQFLVEEATIEICNRFVIDPDIAHVSIIERLNALSDEIWQECKKECMHIIQENVKIGHQMQHSFTHDDLMYYILIRTFERIKTEV